MKLVHLVGFIIKKFVTMRGHMNIKKMTIVDVVADTARMDNHIPIRYPATDSESTFVFKADSNDSDLQYLEF